MNVSRAGRPQRSGCAWLLSVPLAVSMSAHASLPPVPAKPEELVASWATSWERQDFARYASFYSESFSADGFKSLKQWLEYRRPRVLRPTELAVRIDDVKLIESEPDRMVVEFIQHYRSERIQMYSIKKQVWRWEQAVWKIQGESSTDIGPVRPLISGEVIRPLSVGEPVGVGVVSPPPAPPGTAVVPPVVVGVPRPQPQAPTAPAGFSFRLESPERSSIPRAIDALRFIPVKIQIDGASVFSEEELDRVTSSLEGKESTVEDLRQLAERIEAKYKEAGFFLTRVFVPPQHVRNGLFKIRVVEGFIADIEVEGASPRMREQVREQLEPLTLMRPARLDAIERTLLILNDSPQIAVSSILRPGRQLGSSTLVAQVEEQNRAPGAISVSNQIGEDSGDYVVRVSQQFLGLGSDGDALELQAGVGDRPDRFSNASVRYLMPLRKDGLTASIGYVSSRARPAGEAAAFDVVSASEAATARLRLPIRRERGLSLFAEVGLSAVRSDTDVLGSRVYSDRYDTADLSVQLVDWATSFGLTSASLGLSQAIKDRSSLPSTDTYDERQRKATASLRQVIPVNEAVSFSIGAQAQFASRPLLSGEKISFGGAGIGRGFEPGFIAGDRGFGISAEVGYAVGFGLTESLRGRGQFYAFVDKAKTASLGQGGAVTSRDDLYSAGVGLRFQATNGLKAEILWARPIKSSRPRSSFSNGVFFSVTYSW